LNIFSIRSVIRKPETMFVVEANTATAPRIVANASSPAPARISEPTIEIAPYSQKVPCGPSWRFKNGKEKMWKTKL